MGRPRLYTEQQAVDWAARYRAGESLGEIAGSLGLTRSRVQRAVYSLPNHAETREAHDQARRGLGGVLFWRKVEKTDSCWIWKGCKSGEYGVYTGQGDDDGGLAYRRLYQHLRGPIPEGLELDHLCRNPACVNPDHLEPVTHAENLRRGNSTRITMEIACAIYREVVFEGAGGSATARKYGVPPSLVSNIKHGRRWAEAGTIVRQEVHS